MIKRRLVTFKSLVEKLLLNVKVRLFKSGDNKADVLTWVWRKLLAKSVSAIVVTDMESMHHRHHTKVVRA